MSTVFPLSTENVPAIRTVADIGQIAAALLMCRLQLHKQWIDTVAMTTPTAALGSTAGHLLQCYPTTSGYVPNGKTKVIPSPGGTGIENRSCFVA